MEIEDDDEPVIMMVTADEYFDELDRLVFQAIGRAFEDQTPEEIERAVDAVIIEGRRRRIG